MRTFLTDADHQRLMDAIREGQRRNRLLIVDHGSEATHASHRLAERIANAAKLRDGGEMFLDLPECRR